MRTPRLLLAAAAACLTVVTAWAGDPTGTWKWSVPGRDGQAREVTAKLELKEGKLTGAVSGRQGAELPISDATFTDDVVTFSTVMERNGNKVVTKYVGKLAGDTLVGTIEGGFRGGQGGAGGEGGGGNRGPREWKATRAPSS